MCHSRRFTRTLSVKQSAVRCTALVPQSHTTSHSLRIDFPDVGARCRCDSTCFFHCKSMAVNLADHCRPLASPALSPDGVDDGVQWKVSPLAAQASSIVKVGTLHS